MPMPYYRNTSSAPLFALLGMVIVCLMILFTPRVLSPTLTKITGKTKLLEFEKDFEKIKHPQMSDHLSFRSKVGNFTSDKMGCDFFVGEMHSFDGDERTVQASYYDQKVKNVPIQVLFLVKDKFTDEIRNVIPTPLNEESEWKLPKNEGISSMYLAYLIIEDYVGDMKLDCGSSE